MICLIALSVALAGYISCLIASHIHWEYGWISAPAVLPGLSFGLAIAGWLLHRGWIGRRKAVGLMLGSTVAYFAAYWSAFYIFAWCGKGMILSASRLPLFHAGMIAGLVGTALLIASLAAVSADFRRKDWKTLILIGVAAGGALCLAGIGASSGDHPGTLANPGDKVFIVVWQLLVGGYVGMLLLADQGSSKPAERGRIAHRATRAVFALLVASFVQTAVGYLRGDKEVKVVSPAISSNSNVQASTASSFASIPIEALKMAAEAGDKQAMLKLGDAYEQGIGVEKDPSEAVRWYLKAFEKGDVDAMYRIVLIDQKAIDDDLGAMDRGVTARLNRQSPSPETETLTPAIEKAGDEALEAVRNAADKGDERASTFLKEVRQRVRDRKPKIQAVKEKLETEGKDIRSRAIPY